MTMCNAQRSGYFLRLSVFGASLGVLAGCASVGIGDEPQQGANSAEASRKDLQSYHAPNTAVEELPDHLSANGTDGSVEPSAVPDDTSASTAVGLPDDPSFDLWDRIRVGLALPGYEHQRTQTALRILQRNQRYLDQITERAGRYLYQLVEAVEQRQLPMELALLPIVESGLQPFAYSHARAAGLWQFIPSTGRIYGLKQNWWYDGRRDIVESTRAALDYLQKLHDLFKGDWLLAIAAYNSGQGSVRRAVASNLDRGKPADFWSLRLPTETRDYVPRLLALAAVVADPDRYSLTLRPVANKPYFERVTIDGQIDLALAAELAEISLEELYMLNPAFNHWATDPDGPHHLLLPAGGTPHFSERLAGLPAEQRVKWHRHRIRGGHTLSGIAKQYQTTVPVLRQVNNLRGSTIRAGDSLIVPVAARSLAQYTLSAYGRRSASRDTPSPETTKHVYAVKKGDTLWSIARYHSVSTRHLTKWNGIALADPLRPGQELSIWIHTKEQDNPTRQLVATTGGPSITGKTIRRIRYVVRRGDSLWNISRRFRVTVPSLREWNRITEGAPIKPGQRLDVFIDVTQQLENT
nr:LysM peptidoglycan-binding domain-containing protein [Gammaproteobacteria bacterium]